VLDERTLCIFDALDDQIWVMGGVDVGGGMIIASTAQQILSFYSSSTSVI
jgi:hypothetical protein